MKTTQAAYCPECGTLMTGPIALYPNDPYCPKCEVYDPGWIGDAALECELRTSEPRCWCGERESDHELHGCGKWDQVPS